MLDEQKLEQNDQSAKADDRRSSERHVTTLCVGKITRKTGEELCIVRNLSSSGAMVRVFSPLIKDEQILLEIKSEVKVEAIPVWIDNNVAGLKFIEPVDCKLLLSPCLLYGRRPRAHRLHLAMPGRLQNGDNILQIVTADISQTGAKIHVGISLTSGARVRLWLDGICSRYAAVRWCHDNMAGIIFDQPITPKELTEWSGQMRLQYENTYPLPIDTRRAVTLAHP